MEGVEGGEALLSSVLAVAQYSPRLALVSTMIWRLEVDNDNSELGIVGRNGERRVTRTCVDRLKIRAWP